MSTAQWTILLVGGGMNTLLLYMVLKNVQISKRYFPDE
jgi:hypothetical protein